MRKSFTREYIFKSSPAFLFTFITNPNHIARWFCDDVEMEGDLYSFYWDGFAEEAELVESIEDEYVKYQFVEEDDDEYLEFKLSKSGITGDTILLVTAYADEDEIEQDARLWDSQIETLRANIGG